MPRSAEAGPAYRSLTGWGRTSPSVSRVHRPRSVEDVVRTVTEAGERGVLARGLGRSYGDAAQNGGGEVLDVTGLAGVHRIDADQRRVEVDAGVSLDALLRALFPLGLTLPVQPGTRQVTVGGALAHDVHGKNHHTAGSFGHYVRRMELLTADGRVRSLTPEGPDPELFWGTVGGLGLTGVILRVELEVRRVETSYVLARSERRPDLRGVMEALAEQDTRAEYSVAWFDSVARGRSAGRGVVLTGRDAVADDLDPRRAAAPRRVPGEGRLAVPPGVPGGLVNRLSGRAFNEAWFRSAPRRPTTRVEPAFGFFHPLDAIASWNRLYGPRGMCQYQLVVPFEARDVVPEVVRTIAATPHVSCLNVLKRFGPGTRAPMSFPVPGWTLAVDLAVRPGLLTLLDRLDAMVLEAGGRLYLAKDARVPARLLPRMYPRLPEFQALLSRVDPQGVFISDLARRLAIRTTTPKEQVCWTR